jgi:hypothetical protein
MEIYTSEGKKLEEWEYFVEQSGSIRAIPKSLADSSRKLKWNDALCCQEGDILVHNWKDKREGRMIGTINNGRRGYQQI